MKSYIYTLRVHLIKNGTMYRRLACPGYQSYLGLGQSEAVDVAWQNEGRLKARVALTLKPRSGSFRSATKSTSTSWSGLFVF